MMMLIIFCAFVGTRISDARFLGFQQRFQLGQVFLGQVACFQKASDHRRERAVEGMLKGVEQFAFLCMFGRHCRTVERLFARLFRGEQPLGGHAVHQRSDGRISPLCFSGEQLLNLRSGARLLFPDPLDNDPFRLGKLNWLFSHTPQYSLHL